MHGGHTRLHQPISEVRFRRLFAKPLVGLLCCYLLQIRKSYLFDTLIFFAKWARSTVGTSQCWTKLRTCGRERGGGRRRGEERWKEGLLRDTRTKILTASPFEPVATHPVFPRLSKEKQWFSSSEDIVLRRNVNIGISSFQS